MTNESGRELSNRKGEICEAIVCDNKHCTGGYCMFALTIRSLITAAVEKERTRCIECVKDAPEIDTFKDKNGEWVTTVDRESLISMIEVPFSPTGEYGQKSIRSWERK